MKGKTNEECLEIILERCDSSLLTVLKKQVYLLNIFAKASLRILRLCGAEAKCENVTYVNVKLKVD
jgi:hypothetical protein